MKVRNWKKAAIAVMIGALISCVPGKVFADEIFVEDDFYSEDFEEGEELLELETEDVFEEPEFFEDEEDALFEDDEFEIDAELLTEGSEEELQVAAEDATSGTCGDNLTWTLDSEGILTIRGTGPMWNYDAFYEGPFYPHRDDIYSVIIENGVTSIGMFAFSSCISLISVTIPNSVTSIGEDAFSLCVNLTNITIPDSVKSIGEEAFNNSNNVSIYGYTGSYAEIYAIENNIPFVVLYEEVAIPEDAVEYNGHHYYVYNIGGSYADAENYCEDLGGYLATISSQGENDFLFDYITSKGIKSAYFGYTDREIEGQWYWIHDENSSYTNWASREPNSENTNEDYAMFYWKYTSGKWNDGNFGNAYFICEWGEPIESLDDYIPGFCHALDYYASTSSSVYNPELACDLMKLAWDAYGPKEGNDRDIKADYENLGFEVSYSENYDKWKYYQDYCGFSFAVKDVDDGGQIVVVTVRGTVGEIGVTSDFPFISMSPEWLSNLLGTLPPLFSSGWHTGFYNPAIEIVKSLEANNLIKTTNTKYFITGHSRGAGVGNVLAVLLSQKGISKENLYAYNFACPDTMYAKIGTDWSGGGRYNNIFNINAANDLVGVVPGIFGNQPRFALQVLLRSTSPSYNWGKYGKTYFYSFDWNSNASSMVNIVTFLADSGSTNPHQMSMYSDYLSKKNPVSAFRSFKGVLTQNLSNMIVFLAFCPVDMTIVDGNGADIVSVKGGEITYYNNYSMGNALVMTDGDFKAFFVDPSIECKVKIEATDSGDMAFVSGISNISTGEFETEKHFENVKLENGKTFLSEGLSGTSAENVKLYTTDISGNKVAEVNSNGEETKIEKQVSPQPKKTSTPTDKITVTKKPSIKKPTATKNKITVKWSHFKYTSKKTKKIWKPIKKVQIQCATDKSFKNIVKTTMVKKSKTKAVIKSLKKNTTYYVRIRYYDGTGYSNWSKVKKIKTKKK